MNFILLTRDGPEHCYVANRMAEEVGLSAIVVDQGRPLSIGARLQQYRKRYTTGQILGRVILRGMHALWCDREQRRRQLDTVLGARSQTFERSDLLHTVQGINTKASRELIKSLQADVLLVYGTGIIGKHVLELSRHTPLNMHTGISPFYRGTNCTFWAIYNGELEQLGATVHECTLDVDGGRIFGTIRAQLDTDDQLHMVFGRCVVAGSDLYCKIARQMRNSEIEGEYQDLSQGCEYTSAMYGLGAEIRVRRLIRRGIIRDFVLRQSLSVQSKAERSGDTI